MDKREKQKRNMGGKVILYVDANGTMYSGYTDYTDEIVVFRAILVDWDNLESQESVQLGGALDAKNPLKSDTSEFWAMTISTARIYQMKPSVNNLILAEDLNQSEPEIRRLGDVACANRCDHFYTVLKAALPMVGTGIDLALLDEGKAITDAFRAKIGTPKMASNEKNSFGPMIDTLITERFEPSLERLSGLTHGIYFRHKKDYVDGFDVSTAIDELATEHTRITLTIVDVDGVPIRYATGKELNSNKSGVADAAGVAIIEEFTGGKDTDLLIKAVGFVNHSITKDITTGEKYAYTVVMVRVPDPTV